MAPNILIMKKVSSILWTLLFVVFAVFQANDPDAIIWILIYGAAALLALLVFLNKISRPVLWVALVAFVAGSAMLWPDSFEGLQLKEGMYSPAIELARESLGLLIAAVSMAWHLFVSKAGTPAKT